MSKLNIGEIKESSNPTDYEKAMLYHSDRADKYMDELASLREQLAKERQLRKELYQATYDWTNHMELWLEEAKFRIDSADLEDLKALIQQGEKAIQKAKGT